MQTHEYKKMRKMFFTHHSYAKIAEELQVSMELVAKTIKEKRLSQKRDRYYLYLVQYAYAKEMQVQDVAKICGISPVALNRVKRKHGIKTKRFRIYNKKITNAIKQQMISLYLEGNTCREIAQKFQFKSGKTVEDVLRENQIVCRDPCERRSLDYTFFDKIDSHDKAYILGLIYTDGYIYKEYGGFCIQLTEDDGYLLKAIAEKIGPSATMMHVCCDSKRKVLPNTKDMWRLGVYSKILAEQLRCLGVVKRKTYHLEIPLDLIPEEFHPSLLRGILDGDGSVGIAKTKNIWFTITTKSERFADTICLLEPGFLYKYEYENSFGKMYSVKLYGGNKKTIEVLRKIYLNKNDLYLKRKYSKIEMFL